jgi:uncharacterized protein (TIGR02145 family)
MNLRRCTLYVSVLCALVLGVASCHKDDDTTTSDYFDGTLSFSVPSFVRPGESYKLVPSGVTNPSGNGIGYFWLVSDIMSANDTTKYYTDSNKVDSSFTFVAPTTLGDYTVKCVAFADGYYDSSLSKSVTVVSSESITGNGITSEDPSIIDNREGDETEYFYMTAGNLLWLKQNVSYSKTGVSYENSPAMTKLFGNFYTWEQAKTACPDGWRLPTDAEWVSLAKSVDPTKDFKVGETFSGIGGNLMADIYFNSTKMWEYWPNVKITNSTGFAALPAGYAVISDTDNKFHGVQEYAAFWTADEFNADQAVYRYINVNQSDVLVGAADKSSFAASVRCVKNK